MTDPQVPHARPCARTGLYVHVPFCETKCGYCDFYSVPLKGRETAPLVRSLLRELKQRATRDDPIRTVFIGGGTPTLLPVNELKALLAAVGESVRVEELEEFTVEANPATVEDEKARALRESGVTRVSMGAQSFFPNELAALERLHTPDDIGPSVEILRRCGIEQVNLDLIFGIPGQTSATWTESLRRAIELRPNHIACYGLTYEPATRLTAQRDIGRVTPCDDGVEAEMYLLAIDTLTAAGYQQYEISNFAQPGCASQHNLIYWRNEPYIGVGPSAAGCAGRRRYRNVADLGAYVRMIEQGGLAETFSETIDDEMLATEMVMMQLRLNEGLNTTAFQERTGHDALSLFEAVISSLVQRGILETHPERIALTRQGRLVADSVIRELAICIPSARTGRTLTVLS